MTESFYNLTPEQVMRAAESSGFDPTGEYTQLNSYENRVFDIRLEKGSHPQELNERVIAKFYRPGRWSYAAIQEEHFFLQELKSSGIPVVAPLPLSDQSSIFQYRGLYLAFFPKFFGRTPQELFISDYEKIGRSLARIHNIGQMQTARYRPILNAETMGWPVLDLLKEWVSPEVWGRYKKASTIILKHLDGTMNRFRQIRIHGDCHRGNLLLKQNREEPEDFFLIDFDDFCTGPAVQDFWMLFSGDANTLGEEEEAILSGYEELRIFDRAELGLIPLLRGLRIIHYAGWIARRWDDPSFPRLFPAFTEYNYWAYEVESLEKIAWAL